MKALILAVLLVFSVFVGTAMARCITHTITTADGRMVVCTTCCYGQSCNTTCF